jgi:hypothetical protein
MSKNCLSVLFCLYHNMKHSDQLYKIHCNQLCVSQNSLSRSSRRVGCSLCQLGPHSIINNQEPIHITTALQYHPNKLLHSYNVGSFCTTCGHIIIPRSCYSLRFSYFVPNVMCETHALAVTLHSPQLFRGIRTDIKGN